MSGELWLNGVSELPRAEFDLQNLRILRVRDSSIEALAPQLKALQQLEVLDLRSNDMQELSPEILELPSLEILDISRNKLSRIPSSIRALKKLRYLYAGFNEIRNLPIEIGDLCSLQFLDLTSNRLRTVPTQIKRLMALRGLYLGGNPLTFVPPELGLLPGLNVLHVDPSRDASIPEPVKEQGSTGILAYLRAKLSETVPQWVSKLILVGEGGVGKTSLVQALLGEPFSDTPTTHGISLRELPLKHPGHQDTVMRLRTWDFGGQEIYHATHQFFLTNRALFLLLWNARLGFEQGKLFYWLDTIQARAPDSPVLLVSTHIDERVPDLPLGQLQVRYPQIRGAWSVSNRTGAGVPELHSAICREAATLPLMGELWPGKWVRAADALRSITEKWISKRQLTEVLSDRGLQNTEQTTLTMWLHELGELLHFRDDAVLNDLVILKPEWMTAVISRVLDSSAVAANGGLLTRDEMLAVWGDIDVPMRGHLIRLMERFDLSYRTLEDQDISIVVERLPYEPPAAVWAHWAEMADSTELSIKYQFGSTIPAGLPTWFIARSHRFTTYNHWRSGCLLKEGRHIALVVAHAHERYIRLVVRGPHPHNFFAKLRDGLELTIGRFPGLKTERLVPCPGHSGNSCKHEFELEHLERATQQSPPVLEMQCPQSFKMVSVAQLLFGINWSIEQWLGSLKRDVRELLELSQREFLNIYRREQASIDTNCPNVFTLEPVGGLQTLKGSHGGCSVIESLAQPWRLQLYCQAPGQWHPTWPDGSYTIVEPAGWIQNALPYLMKLLSILKYSVGLTGGLSVDIRFKEQVSAMEALLNELPNVTERSTSVGVDLGLVYGADLRVLQQLLSALDPSQKWGGLRKIFTPEGHCFWLCKVHAGEYVFGGEPSLARSSVP